MVTGNVRTWRDFLRKRGSRHADPEIRALAFAVYEILNLESPNLFNDYSYSIALNGVKELTSPYREL